MELDSLAIALEGVGFDSILVATQGLSAFDVFEFEEVQTPSFDFRLLSSRRPRGRSSRWKRERRVIVSVKLNGAWLEEETTRAAIEEQTIDEDQPTISVVGRYVKLEVREPISVTIEEFKINSKPRDI